MTAEEVEFFDRVKQHINNKATYNEFLKVLNLFSQQLLDQNTLVERVDTFIGNDKKLFKWFKEFVGYDGKDEIVENIPATVTRPDFLQSKSFGQSYRLIPRMVSLYRKQSYSLYPISNLNIFISFNLKPAQAEIHYVVKSSMMNLCLIQHGPAKTVGLFHQRRTNMKRHYIAAKKKG